MYYDSKIPRNEKRRQSKRCVTVKLFYLSEKGKRGLLETPKLAIYNTEPNFGRYRTKIRESFDQVLKNMKLLSIVR